MNALLKFLRCSSPTRRMYVGALLAVVSALRRVRLGPYAGLRKRIETVPIVHTHSGVRPSSETLVSAVHAVARRLTGASCLVQAIAAQDLLACYGYGSRLRIGVALDDDGKFSAHAWLEGENNTVSIGGRTSTKDFAALQIPIPSHSSDIPPA